MIVKKFIAVTTLCAALICAGTGAVAASADASDSGITIPVSFSVELSPDSVTDYAVTDGSFAFAEGKYIYIYSSYEDGGTTFSGGELESYEHTASVTGLEYKSGNLYFSDASGSYLYSGGAAASASVSFTEYDDSKGISEGDYLYYINNGALTILNKDAGTLTPLSDGVYKGLKEFDGVIYVLKDATLCTLADGAVSELSFWYDDYDEIGSIETGNTAEALKTASDVRLAAISENACLIRVNDEELSGDYFETLGVSFASGDENAQVLLYPDSGNAALIGIGEKAYLTLKSNITLSNFEVSTAAISYGYLIEGAGIYSMPFESESTRAATLSAGTIVTVVGTAANSAFDYSYYKVEYTESGNTVSGYIITSLLSPYIFSNENNGGENISNETQYENNITTIVLVMIIVCLVLVAAAYITWVATAKPRKKSDK